jgi:NSS family neurotransmitter:Na+ symporter
VSESKAGGEKFSSFWGFLMVTIGFAVGVGSLWRFPYVCGSNGGALFIAVYLLIILFIGIPLLTAEMSLGFATKKTAMGAYKALKPGGPWHLASWLHIAAALFIISYTVPIYAWILNYVYRTVTGHFVSMSYDGLSAYFGDLTGDYPQVFVFLAVNWLLLFLVVRGGLQNGVEKISKFLLPILAVIMLVIIAAGLRIPGAGAGVEFLLKPDFSKFTFQSLLTALGQAFFAIGIGMLASMVFGSYIRDPGENICKNSVIVCASIIFAGLAAGFMIFPMVFALGMEPEAGPGLTFLTLPNVFNNVPGGRLIGSLFYIGFYIAAFTSAIGVLEALVATFRDIFSITREKALTILMILQVALGVPSVLYGPFFNFMDTVTSNYLIVIGAFIISIFVGWVWGIENFLDAANVKNRLVRMWLSICVKFISPVAIVIIFIGQM